MARTSLAVVFSGSGGAGAMSAGELLLNSAAEAGYYGAMSRLFGAQVRGGEAAALVQISTAPVSCQPDRYDLFVVLDWTQVDQFAPEIPLDAATIIIADPLSGPTPASIAKSKAKTIPLTLGKADATPLERALHGKHTNVFVAGVVATLAGLPVARLRAALTKVLGGKSKDVTRTNAAALEAGIAAAAPLNLDLRLDPPQPAARWLLTGNQAVAMGALRGGVRFVGCYPITPATDLVEWLSPQLQKLGGRLVMAEDELASQHGARRVLWRRAGNDRDVRPRPFADDGVHWIRYRRRGASGNRQRDARRSVHRHSLEDRAKRHQHRDLWRPRRRAAHRVGANLGAGLHVHRRMGRVCRGIPADPRHRTVRHGARSDLYCD
jgi:Pyruvate/2-oxoacid:ferredoxin oxidoreductase gamma subunit